MATRKKPYLRKNDLMISIGKLIKGYRDRRGLTLQELSNISGIKYMQLWRIENGKVNTSVSHVGWLMEVLQIRSDELASAFTSHTSKKVSNEFCSSIRVKKIKPGVYKK